MTNMMVGYAQKIQQCAIRNRSCGVEEMKQTPQGPQMQVDYDDGFSRI